LTELTIQHELASAWKTLIPSFSKENIHVLPSIEHAVQVVNTLDGSDSRTIDVLVAGSLLLVGGMIEAASLSSVAL